MFIETQSTPNPDTLKFIPDRQVYDGNGVEIKSSEEALKAPLASKIFTLSEVFAVFIGRDFISVTKKTGQWKSLKVDICNIITDHFLSGEPAVIESEEIIDKDKKNYSDEDMKIVNEIYKLLDTRIRPAVAHDGGDIVFSDYKNGIVFLQMRGACAGCPISSVTLKQGVENLLKHFIPQIIEVRAVE